MFKNLQTYRLPAPWAMTAEALAAALAGQSFTPCASNDLLREGWDTIRDVGFVYAVNGQFLLKLTSEHKVLPAAVVQQAAHARALEQEEAQGFYPGKKAFKEIKERVADELLPRAFTKRDSIWVWIDPVNGWLAVDTASPSKADGAIKLLLKAVDRLPLESLRVQRSPVGAMTEWLQSDKAPAGFTIDQDATLQATGESKATVQWKRHTLDAVELGRHIAAGKQCVRLAMTWESKISFVLDESLTVKSLKLLDVLTEKAVTLAEAEKFDSEFALFAGEAAKLLADLVEALGGEATVGNPGEQKAAPTGIGQQKLERAVGLSAELYKVRERYRDVLAEMYEPNVAPYILRVREQMESTGESAIKCAIDMAHARPAGASADQMLLVAAVEILEPSPRPAAGDEAVRAQRVVASVAEVVT